MVVKPTKKREMKGYFDNSSNETATTHSTSASNEMNPGGGNDPNHKPRRSRKTSLAARHKFADFSGLEQPAFPEPSFEAPIQPLKAKSRRPSLATPAHAIEDHFQVASDHKPRQRQIRKKSSNSLDGMEASDGNKHSRSPRKGGRRSGSGRRASLNSASPDIGGLHCTEDDHDDGHHQDSGFDEFGEDDGFGGIPFEASFDEQPVQQEHRPKGDGNRRRTGRRSSCVGGILEDVKSGSGEFSTLNNRRTHRDMSGTVRDLEASFSSLDFDLVAPERSMSRKSNRRSSLLGAVNVGGLGGGNKLAERLDDEAGGKKKNSGGFFKDRKSNRKDVGRSKSDDGNVLSEYKGNDRDRRRNGGLALSKSSRSFRDFDAEGPSYSDRIMMNR